MYEIYSSPHTLWYYALYVMYRTSMNKDVLTSINPLQQHYEEFHWLLRIFHPYTLAQALNKYAPSSSSALLLYGQ